MMEKNIQGNKRSKYWWLILLVVLIAVNWLASIYHARFDLTKEKRYTLSKPTKELLRNLDEPVIIDVFLEGELPSGFRKLSNSVSELLQEFKEYGKGNVLFNFHSPDDLIADNVKYSDTLSAMGVVPINLTVQVKAGEQQQYLFPVAWIHHKDQSIIVDIYTGAKRFISHADLNSAEALMEYQFINAIKKLTNSSLPFVGYSIGNGQPVGPEIEDLIENTLRPNYQLAAINLNTQPIVPDTFKVLFVVKPTQTFSEEVKLKIDQYVMRGGRIIWLIENLAAEMDSLQLKGRTIAYERNLNLTDLLFRYGARINPDLVMDLQCDFLPFIVGGSQENPQYEFLKWNYFPLFESRSNHSINKNLRLISGRFVNSIDTIKTENIKKTFLLSSSQNSRTIGSPALISLSENKNAAEDENFKKGNIPVAVLLEGRFRSLYANRVSKSIQDTLNKYQTPFTAANQSDNKMIVIADGDIVLNEVSVRDRQTLPMGVNQYTLGTNYEYQFANRDFILNCIEYLIDDGGLMEIRNKDFVLRVLDSKRVEEERTKWQIINLTIPIIFILFSGFVFYYLRRRKYAA